MDKIELLGLINKGEFSFVEFKADPTDIKAETIAEYVVCSANSKGGTILLGVEDDRTITGLKERAYNIRHQLNYPPLEQSAIEESFNK